VLLGLVLFPLGLLSAHLSQRTWTLASARSALAATVKTGTLAGDWAPIVGFESKLRLLSCMTHDGGLEHVELFARAGVTHLLLDLNRDRARLVRRLYPGLLERSTVLFTFPVRRHRWALYRLRW